MWKATYSLCLTVALAFLPSAAVAQPAQMGTFNRKAIVISFYRSPLWAATLKEKHAALEEAKRSHDAAKVRDLEAWGESQQELAHQQLEGKAPITNILEALKPAFLEIEESEHLSEIAPAPYRNSNFQTVDVTDRLLDWLKADAETRRIIGEITHQ